MQDSAAQVAAQVPTAMKVAAVQFESNEEFQKRNLNDGDSAFQRFQRKSWMRPSGDTHANREVMATFLSSQGDCSDECVEKLVSEGMSFRDLASLTHDDLELMGFKHIKQREELLASFAQLPNQDPTYASICKLPEAQAYNQQIFNSAAGHLEAMRSAMAAANYKLKIMPPDDVTVGEKSFASRFVCEALSELNRVATEIDTEFQEIEHLVAGPLENKKPDSKAKKVKATATDTTMLNWIILSSVATGVLAALWFWKFN